MSNGAVTVETSRSAILPLGALSDDATLSFTEAEWRAFLAGARVREFGYPGMSITVS